MTHCCPVPEAHRFPRANSSLTGKGFLFTPVVGCVSMIPAETRRAPPFHRRGGEMTYRPGRNELRRAAAALVVGAICVGGPFGLAASEVRVGRYTSVPAAPTEAQANLLSTLVTVVFPSQVSTVGEAMRHLLSVSGYRLVAETGSDSARSDLLAFPLPEAHRRLGPMPLQDALETLAGPAFRLVEDPLHRLVAFERCTSRKRSSSNPRDPDRR